MWHPGWLGTPVLEECLAHLERRITVRYPAGDHTIMLGEAVAVDMPAGEAPSDLLLYFRGRYVRLVPPALTQEGTDRRNFPPFGLSGNQAPSEIPFTFHQGYG